MASARAASREALRHLAELLGHPAEWGDELEENAYARGVVWRFVPADGNA